MRESFKNKLEKTENKVAGWLVKMITPKSMAVFTTAVYVLSLVPLLWIAWYNYPSADDYSIGSNCHQTWTATRNIFAVIWQGIVRAADDWLHWMGYFTSNFLMAMPPNAFGERFYVLTTWIMLAMLSFSTMYLFRAVFVKVFKADKWTSHSVSMLVLFASVQCMCPAGRVEAFYWYSGAANYIFVHSMSLFFYGLLISAVYDKGKKRIWDLAAASVVGFFTGGGNQMTALNGAVTVLAAVVLITCNKSWKVCKGLGIPMGLFCLGFLLNVAAPGNWVRAEGASGMNPVKAVLVSFYECLDRAMGDWTTWPVLVLMISLVPLFWHMAGQTAYRFSNPLFVVLFGYCLVAAMVTPPLFAVGNIEAGRLQALTFLMYVLVLSLCVGYVTGWARRMVYDRNGTEGRGFPPESCWCLAGCLGFLIIGSVLTVVPEPHFYTFSSALTDLSGGSAQAYGNARKERMELYENGAGKSVEVEALTEHPVLLYFSDIKEDAKDWENEGLSRFYGLEEVAVKKE